MKDRAIITIAIRSTAAAWETGSTGFAAKLTVEATHAGLSRTPKACTIVQTTTMHATKGTTQDNLVFIDCIIATTHDEHNKKGLWSLQKCTKVDLMC